MEGRQLGLRNVAYLSELLGGARLIKAAIWGVLANRFQAAKRAQTRDVGGHHGGAPGFRNVGHGTEVVELIGLGLAHGVIDGVLVGQIAVDEVKVLVFHLTQILVFKAVL